ncbi:hypothetical protein PFICI_13343 [Pestalotiopsis fici W106-1]|uniref:Uncharacterized protein n=1 Tax=Pestalotiopsis fici (strain W106-1 / CGMCC3.15140) TaxID=1229662 RepID=W3WM70_PESFW|nr:uncharacterized protein PFICI_13343 [Pestalotiopsis fici W106-1]ETS74859.1 hypothetical protein PFICI_13343 [Pestalotiopsis fici W106-1]
MAPVKELSNWLPTRSIPELATKIIARQTATTTVVAPAPNNNNNNNNLSGGAIAGIVIGSVAGFLLLSWLLYSCFNLSRPRNWGETFGEKDTVYTRSPSRSRHRHHHHHHHSRRNSEVRPVYVETRGRSPRSPQPVYYARDVRRSKRDGRSYYG